ncbi:hypothetical protein SLA2020_209290 [Shorea laevis]
MANQSTQEVIEELKKLLSEKGDLDCEVQGKIERLIAELKWPGPVGPHFVDPAVKRIFDGFNRFKTCKFDKNPELFAELAKGQHPKFLVFACSDSRVSPSHILDFQPGEAFMARNIANMVPEFDKIRYSGVGAVIEYAVGSLEVRNILVIGHSKCGGIQRLMTHPEDGSNEFDFIDDWVRIGLPAKEKVLSENPNLSLEEQLKLCEKESVKNSVRNLWSYPYVKKAVLDGNLKLWGGYYDFVHGKFELLEDAHALPVVPF